jgi:hypothetical protein
MYIIWGFQSIRGELNSRLTGRYFVTRRTNEFISELVLIGNLKPKPREIGFKEFSG